MNAFNSGADINPAINFHDSTSCVPKTFAKYDAPAIAINGQITFFVSFHRSKAMQKEYAKPLSMYTSATVDN